MHFSNDVREACKDVDLIIIHTEWDEFKTIDFKKILKKKNSKIFDMRNLYNPGKMKDFGFLYYSIG